MESSHQRKQCSYQIFIGLIMILVVPCSCQEISALGIEESLCPGERIILTCETRGSSTIAWRSMDYIGDMSDQLEFSRFSSTEVPNNSPVYNTTTAILTANREDNGVRVLISQLHITVRSDVSSTSVICVRDNEMEDIATLHLLSVPDRVNMISNQIQILNSSRCIVQYSWITPNNVNINSITHFMVTFNGTNETVPHTGESLYIRARSVCACATHTINIAAVDRCNQTSDSSDQVISHNQVSQLYTECEGDTDSISTVTMLSADNASFRAKGSQLITAVTFLIVCTSISLIVLPNY